MKANLSLRRALAALVAILAGTFGAAVPAAGAQAAPKPPATPAPAIPIPPGVEHLHLKVPSHVIKGHGADTSVAPFVDIECFAQPTPQPFYTASNRTIGWGAFEQCNVVASLHWTLSLYYLTGAHTRVLDDTPKNQYGTGTTLSLSYYTACLGTTTTTWETGLSAYADGISLQPNPVYSPAVSMPCYHG